MFDPLRSKRTARARSAISHRVRADRRDGGIDISVPPPTPHRAADLYDIPPRSDDVWRRILLGPPEGERPRSRIMRSHHTRGEAGTILDHQRVERVVDWSLLPDLLFLNPLQWLLAHPQYLELWLEAIDDDSYSASHGTGSVSEVVSAASSTATTARTDATPTTDFPGALVLRRSEFTFDLAVLLRELQFEAFNTWNVCPPHSSCFLSTIHGR